VSEVRAKLIGAAFDLLEDTFDGGPTPMSDVVKSEAEAMKGCLVPWSTIDDKSSVLDLMFLCGFGEKHPGDGSASRRIESHVFLSLCLRFVVAIANYKQGANPGKTTIEMFQLSCSILLLHLLDRREDNLAKNFSVYYTCLQRINMALFNPG